MPGRPAQLIDYGAFQHPPAALFRDYLAGHGPVASFYEDGWDEDAVAESARRTLRAARHRSLLAEAVARQQKERGSEPAATQAARLADAEATAVVTGQQPGLFGGALYVLYKAIAAVKVARALERRRGAPVVPVFWVASDDSDFAEVRQTSVLDESGRIHTLRYEPRQEPLGQPAWRIVLDATIAPLIEELGRCLPAGLHREEVLEALGRCYRPGQTLSGAFARFLSFLIPDLVVLDPADPALKKLMLPVLCREMLEGSPTTRLAEEVGARLRLAGYHQQVPVRPGFLNLFVLMDGQRRALAAQDGAVEVRGLGRKMALAEAARLLESDPVPWSPGVLLRPLAQDLMLPTAAYVGGPAEIAYHAQIGPAYAYFGIPRPALVPRPSLTLVEPAQARALEADGISLPELQADPEGLLSRWAREAYPEVEAAFARAREALEREMTGVQETLGSLDPTLRAAADAALGRALHQIETLHEKSTRALKKRDQARAERLRRARDALFPGGAFQERGLGLVGPVARHGPALVDEVMEAMDPWAKGHQVIYL